MTMDEPSTILDADGKKQMNPKKFDRSTPKRQTYAYLRLYDPAHGPNAGSPLGCRIVQDMERCFGVHMLQIRGAPHFGSVVHGIGSRNGHRRVGGAGRGGKRQKKAASAKWWHPDAREAQAKMLSDARRRAAL